MLRGQDSFTQSPDTYSNFCFLLLLLSEVEKKQQDHLDCCYTVLLGKACGNFLPSGWTSLAVTYQRFQKARNSVGVMFKSVVRDK